MAFRINRLRLKQRGDAGFSELVSELPDSVDKCLYCGRPSGRRSRDSAAMVLVADEGDDNPLAVYSVVCLTCSAAQPKDQILADWAEGLVDLYGGTDIPDLYNVGKITTAERRTALRITAARAGELE
jgi:hypothetical protein